eukprot:4942606-Amphidinium_carterae.1
MASGIICEKNPFAQTPRTMPKIEERVLRAEQNRLREVEATSRQKMEEEYSRMVNELTANSRVELDQYRTEMG